jgi:site-specific DNA recombinase
MADLYRTKVLNVREALEQEDARPTAADALRGLIDAIMLKPADDGRLGIFVEGNLAAMLRLALNDKRPSERDSLEQIFPVTMVAGAGFEPATFGL